MNIFVFTQIALVGGPMFGVWLLAATYWGIVKSIAWVNDSRAYMSETVGQKIVYKLCLGARWPHYGMNSLELGGWAGLISLISVLGYWHWPVRWVGIIAGSIFVGLHTLRWMTRISKSLAKIRKMAHEHDEMEKSKETVHEHEEE
jgi:hypothetical protein